MAELELNDVVEQVEGRSTVMRVERVHRLHVLIHLLQKRVLRERCRSWHVVMLVVVLRVVDRTSFVDITVAVVVVQVGHGGLGRVSVHRVGGVVTRSIRRQQHVSSVAIHVMVVVGAK